jgi:hypothetical protein
MEYIAAIGFFVLFAYWIYAHVAFSRAMKSYSRKEFEKNSGFDLRATEFDKLSDFLYLKKYKLSNDAELIKAGDRLLRVRKRFYMIWVAGFVGGIVLSVLSFVFHAATA